MLINKSLIGNIMAGYWNVCHDVDQALDIVAAYLARRSDQERS